jgi:hypothetical protein
LRFISSGINSCSLEKRRERTQRLANESDFVYQQRQSNNRSKEKLTPEHTIMEF